MYPIVRKEKLADNIILMDIKAISSKPALLHHIHSTVSLLQALLQEIYMITMMQTASSHCLVCHSRCVQ